MPRMTPTGHARRIRAGEERTGNWGRVHAATPKRVATCRCCGKRIPAGQPALRTAYDFDERLDPTFWHWCYIHREECR